MFQTNIEIYQVSEHVGQVKQSRRCPSFTILESTVKHKVVIHFLAHQFKHVLDFQKNRLNETVLLKTQNICFDCKIKK